MRSRAHGTRRAEGVSSVDKHWSSPRRAGQYAREQARKAQWEYLRRAWKLVAVYVVIVTIAAPLVWLVPAGGRAFALGLYVATFAWLLYFLVARESGSVSRLAGADAEEQTVLTLRSARRHGWKSFNHVFLGRGGDVDHVLVGPAGLVVLETKWSTVPGCVNNALHKLKRDAHRLESRLRTTLGSTTVHPAIVVWGPAADAWGAEVSLREGVTIVPGPQLHVWLAKPRPQVLGPEEQERAWTVLTDQFALREAYEDRR
jgi:hypothetical protein